LLHINYKCLRYANPPPNVTENINFIALLSEWSIANRYIVDQFLVEVVYWQSPEQSIKLVTALVIAAPVILLTFYVLSFQFLMMISLWAFVLSNVDFVRDFLVIIHRSLKNTDFKPIQTFVETKFALIKSLIWN